MNCFNILLLNGPNLNLLGKRESKIYGNITLKELVDKLIQKAQLLNTTIKHIQSNSECKLIDTIQNSKKYDYIIINPASLTHTSIGLRDALLAVKKPFIEVHISNIYARESFRQHSFLSDISDGTIIGLGIDGYFLALNYVIQQLKK